MTGTFSSLVDVYRVSSCLFGLPNVKNVVADIDREFEVDKNYACKRFELYSYLSITVD